MANFVTCYPLFIARCALSLVAMLSLAGIKWQQEFGKRAAPNFSRPSLCLGRTAVILTLLLVVIHVVVLYVHQAGMYFAQKCVNLSVCAGFLYLCLYLTLFLMLVPAACLALCWPQHSRTCTRHGQRLFV